MRSLLPLVLAATLPLAACTDPDGPDGGCADGDCGDGDPYPEGWTFPDGPVELDQVVASADSTCPPLELPTHLSFVADYTDGRLYGDDVDTTYTQASGSMAGGWLDIEGTARWGEALVTVQYIADVDVDGAVHGTGTFSFDGCTGTLTVTGTATLIQL